MRRLVLLFILNLLASYSLASNLWIETETFQEKGGWVLDQQFMDEMGSPYLLAHGMGIPVADAQTTVELLEPGI